MYKDTEMYYYPVLKKGCCIAHLLGNWEHCVQYVFTWMTGRPFPRRPLFSQNSRFEN